MSDRSPSVPLSEVMGRFGTLGGHVRDHLHRRNLRATPARIVVMGVLAGAPGADRRDRAPAPSATFAVPGHLTVLGLQRAIADLAIPFDSTTIYRAVTTLQDVGLVHHVAIRDRAARYGLSDPAHHHAICTDCGTLRSIPAERLAGLLETVVDLADLEPPACGALTLHGRCRACRTAERTTCADVPGSGEGK
ncbi:Fur family transcriptional regulator [Streptomyces sp. 8L]|uniref:Fur family transcriptional regulator n=1 Tax=Streptomyces sp. 8L TaxID=2877242 RepID=UPI001CD693AA|nr:transcriptional repressor [Streptomyces sp. 8L]MCA1217860.1 transcriptional repressor [Streptomyces sp. 8L]